jgi:hypothetical protein
MSLVDVEQLREIAVKPTYRRATSAKSLKKPCGSFSHLCRTGWVLHLGVLNLGVV